MRYWLLALIMVTLASCEAVKWGILFKDTVGAVTLVTELHGTAVVTEEE